MIELIPAIESHGMDPQDYGLAEIRAAVPAGGDLLETLLADAMITIAAHMVRGHVNPETNFPEWNAPAVVASSW